MGAKKIIKPDTNNFYRASHLKINVPKFHAETTLYTTKFEEKQTKQAANYKNTSNFHAIAWVWLMHQY